MFAHGEQVRVLRRDGTTDAYGDPVGLWAQVAVLDGCAVWYRASTDLSGVMRDGEEWEVTVAYPFGADVRASDRLVVRGVEMSIVGVPADWHSPFSGWEPASTVNLKRVDG